MFRNSIEIIIYIYMRIILLFFKYTMFHKNVLNSKKKKGINVKLN